ncbi:MAG: tRNA (adenosine(37)-N6)-threonylcarbamoyltransferase complex transferase subunit TsaD [bacterium]|nr:tRNA (adenosine(37)-N6)-threonylcarbamoyltransferase complex transferase subunit TsaD [bacterium]
MRILGIETSCDDTGIAVVEGKGLPAQAGKTWPKFHILSNIVAPQIEVHKKYGGVYPNLAKREHQINLPIVLKEALRKAKIDPSPSLGISRRGRVDAISVTYGPGLSPCLWTGINFAKELAEQWNLPLIPVDHMEGHLLVGLFTAKRKKPLFPALVLLVSGGHTQLLLMKGIGKYQLLSETRDDAAGEAFDKTARILGLPYPGGPEIAEAAALSKTPLGITLPRPMIHSKDLDFSFSGLKTAVLYDSKKRTRKVRESKEYVRAMAKEIQQAIVDVLLAKTLKAAHLTKAKSIILGGGVSANEELRKQLEQRVKEEKLKVQLFFPKRELATDNGVMAAFAGYFTKAKRTGTLEAEPNLRLE